MIFITVIATFVYGGLKIKEDSWSTWKTDDPPLYFVNTKNWPDAISFAVYAFEGVGVILPVYDITENKEQYTTVVTITCIFISTLYIIYSEFCLFVWYTDMLIEDAPLIVQYFPAVPTAYIIKVLFSFNLVISYPLMLYPANLVVESYLYDGWPKSKKRQLCKNINRAILVVFTIILALIAWNKLDYLLSITGSLFCTPIAFILPSLFHYKSCAETTAQKVIDLSIVSVSCVILVFCTYIGVRDLLAA